MRTVAVGEPILPALTAQWYNHTVKPNLPPPGKRPQPHRHHNRIQGKFAPQAPDYLEALRFDPVAVHQAVDPNFIDHECYVNKQFLNDYNWVIPQATMRAGQLSQPCVYAGLTFANVNILNEWHTHVKVNHTTKTLESSFWGKGVIVAKNAVGPTLISIETASDVGWFMLTLEEIPAASGPLQYGIGPAQRYVMDNAGTLIAHPFSGSVLVYNGGLIPIPVDTIVQTKNYYGMPLVDVVYCDE